MDSEKEVKPFLDESYYGDITEDEKLYVKQLTEQQVQNEVEIIVPPLAKH